MHEIKIPVQELWLKVLGGLYVKGGIYAGHYGICTYICNIVIYTITNTGTSTITYGFKIGR